MDRSKAFEAENGFLIEGGPLYSGGAASPVGNASGAAGDFYLQNAGSTPIFWVCFGPGVNDWRLARVSDFLNVYSIESHTSTLNGSDLLTDSSVTLHRILGTATGFSVQLPDATTIDIGRRFEVSNESSETINLKDGAGTVLLNLISGDFAVATLEADGSAAGNWVITVTSSAATGIASYVVSSNTTFTTTSVSDILITGMSVTPVSGRYSLFFASEVKIAQQNRVAQFVAYVDGVSIENTRRKVQGVGNNFETGVTTLGEIIVNGAQAVDIRTRISSNSLDVDQRSLVLIRLGS